MYGSYVNAKREHRLDRHRSSTLSRIDELIGSGGRTLFDVGAGAGEFLGLARQNGFEPHGIEFAPGAIKMTKSAQASTCTSVTWPRSRGRISTTQ